MITKIKEWFWTRRLRNMKLRAIFEVKKDIEYIRKVKKNMVEYDEGKARKRMAELKNKGETRTEQEQLEYEAVIDVISESKAIKNELEKNVKLVKDLEKYLDII